MQGRSDIVVIIPARYGSSRFPGKPLELLRGTSLLERAHRIASRVKGVSEVFITTDDSRVAEHARAFGAKTVMTQPSCPTGTDRVAQAALALPRCPTAVINLQGDAVLTPPWVLEALVAPLEVASSSPLIVTPAVRLDEARYTEFLAHKQKSPTSGTTVTVGKDGRALYFSKAVIPFVRNRGPQLPPVFRHIGVYGYTRAALEAYAVLPPSELEQAEGLEQLRALENGIPIQVVEVDYRGRTHASIDTVEDLRMAEKILEREGELT